MPKVRKIRGDRVVRGGPLAEQIEVDALAKETGRVKIRKRRDGEDEYVASDLTKRILTQARLQQQELEEEHGLSEQSPAHRKSFDINIKLGTSSRNGVEDDDEDKSDSETEYTAAAEGMQGQEEVDPDDDNAFKSFLASKRQEPAEDVLEKFQTQRTEVETVMSDGGAVSNLPPQLVQVSRMTGDFLRKYKSGPLPKFVKKLPYSEHWEECLELMKPEDWSAASIYAVTKVFASNLSKALAQRFYFLFLLPRVRDDIREYKRLNFHIMQALKKSLFKIHAFFKGIIIPLCQSDDFTVREATIISSVLRESNIQSHVAGVCIENIAMMGYTGPRSIILRTLLDKKYALAYSVVDNVHAALINTTTEGGELTTLWHQCLLTFVQRHKEDFTQEQKDQLYSLVDKFHHHEITPEIKRELRNSTCRPAST